MTDTDKRPWFVYVSGCDDSTLVHVHLTDTEAHAVSQLAELVSKTGGGCQPTMEMFKPGSGHYAEPSDDLDWEEVGTDDDR